MRIESSAKIVSVSPIKENNGFKKCIVRVETPPAKDPDTQETVREAELFDCEVPIKAEQTYTNLLSLMTDKKPLSCVFKLRSFFYTEKNEQKLGKQLVLKKWS